MNIIYADQKDLERARDLRIQIVSKGMDKAIGSANKMAKLIKDHEKLLRRTEAVLSEDLRLAGPFIERCRDLRAKDYTLSEMVRAYETGYTVGVYSTSMPKKYSNNQKEIYNEAFLAGFVSSYGYANFIGSRDYGI